MIEKSRLVANYIAPTGVICIKMRQFIRKQTMQIGCRSRQSRVDCLIFYVTLRYELIEEIVMPPESVPNLSSTPKKASALPVLIATLLVVACSAATYLTTQHFVYADAYAAGHAAGMSEGQKLGYDNGYSIGAGYNSYAGSQYNKLVTKYNNLVTDYNNLRTAVINYIGSTPYQPRTAISCTSNNIGNTTFTNCY